MTILSRLAGVLAAIVLTAMAAHATQPLVLGGRLDGISLSSRLMVLEDGGRSLSFAQVSSAAGLARFRPLGAAHTARGVSSSVWWLTFTVTNPTAAAISWRLQVRNSQAGEVDLFWVRRDGTVRMVPGGLAEKPDIRIRDGRYPVFPVTIGPHRSRRLFVRIAYAQAGLINLSLKAWSAGALALHESRIGMADGVLIGAAAMAVLYNFVLYVFTRNRSFGWYFPYALSACLLGLAMTGLGYRFLWSGSPFVTRWAFQAGVTATQVFALQFSRVFLDTPRLTPVIDRIMRALMAVTAVTLPLTALGARGVSVTVLSVIGLILGVLPVLGFHIWRRGRTEARTFAVVWCLWAASMVVSTLRMRGIVPDTDLTVWLPRAGILLESTLLSFAMLDQIATLRRQKLRAEERARRVSERSRAELEVLVKDRTRDLELAHRQAEQLALTDPLTGIDNRRAFGMRMIQAVALARRYRHSLSVALLDIDFFKRINDTHGHAAGDAVLNTLAATVRMRIRATDLWGRIGGEEFALAFPETGLAEAASLAETLRAEIQALTIALPQGAMRVTVSIGIAELHPDDADHEALLRRADRALYRAKEAGRNQVICDRVGSREIASEI